MLGTGLARINEWGLHHICTSQAEGVWQKDKQKDRQSARQAGLRTDKLIVWLKERHFGRQEVRLQAQEMQEDMKTGRQAGSHTGRLKGEIFEADRKQNFERQSKSHKNLGKIEIQY